MTVRKNQAVALRRIILAIDTSEPSVQALEFVRTKLQPGQLNSNGGRAPSHVTVLHVIKRQPLAPFTVRYTAPWIKSEKKVKDVARKLVDRAMQQLIKAGFTAEPICKVGDPAEEIMNLASKRKADLIVMGAKGLGTIDRILLGSVSTRVVQYATCPVLVVR